MEEAPVVSVLPELMPELLLSLSLLFFILQLSATISMLLTVRVCAFLPPPLLLLLAEAPEAPDALEADPLPVSPVTRTSCPLCAARSWVLLS